MRTTAVCAGIFVAALAGCGGNSTGVASKDNGITPSSGSTDGNGSATGNGSYDPTNAGSTGSNGGTTTTNPTPQTCGQTDPCPSGQVCSSQGGGGRGADGYCVQTCTLPEGITVGKASCPGSELCVRVEQSTVGACVLPCAIDADCPLLAGLEASCVSVDTGGPLFCVWGSPATPGGG